MKPLKIIVQLMFALVLAMALTAVFGWNPIISAAGILIIQRIAPFMPMPFGILAFNFTDLTWNDSLENMGGFTSVAYFAPYQDVLTWPTLSESPTTDEDLTKLSGNFEMKPGKHFIQAYVTPETAALAANNQGETDGQSFRLEGEVFMPGSKTEIKAFARKLNNSRGVLILVDPDGDRVVIGTDKLPAFFKPSLNYGKAAADRKGLTVSFYQNHFAPGLEYNGTIPLDGSTIPAQS